MSEPTGDRRALILELHSEGKTNDEIGRAVQLTRERVRQLIQSYDVASEPRAERLYRFCVTGREAALESLFLALGSDREVAARTGVPEPFVRRFIDARVPTPRSFAVDRGPGRRATAMTSSWRAYSKAPSPSALRCRIPPTVSGPAPGACQTGVGGPDRKLRSSASADGARRWNAPGCPRTTRAIRFLASSTALASARSPSVARDGAAARGQALRRVARRSFGAAEQRDGQAGRRKLERPSGRGVSARARRRGQERSGAQGG